MLDAAAHGLNLSPQRKTLINYWFRHIWELAWPLYPGYILVSSLLNLPLLTILLYTSPLVLLALFTGIFFYLRDVGQGHVPPRQTHAGDGEKSTARALRTVCYEALPIIITIGGAAVFGLIFRKFAPSWPSQAAFIASLACALTVAIFQGRGRMSKPLAAVALNKNILGLVLLVFVIYVFKNVIVSSGIVAQLSGISQSRALMYSLFILLPMLCGMLTGVMVGYVGASFPILLGILNEAGLQEQALPLVVVAMVSGNVGQLATPLHVCMAVTLDYFKVQFVEIWRSLVPPLLVQITYGVLWSLALFFMGARF
jgi:integral membrane protein (TIGR00529 family)